MPTTSRPRRAWLAVAAGAAVAVVATAVALDTGTDAVAQPRPAAGVTLSAGQLLINQRISQAAVRRSNESLRLLDPVRPNANQPAKVLGWRSADLRDGAVTTSKLSEGLREGQPRWVVVAADGSLARQRGATAATRTAFGRYRVTFDRDVTLCALSATIAVVEPTGTVLIDRVPTLGIDPAAPNTVTVRIYQASNPGNSEDAPFHITVLC